MEVRLQCGVISGACRPELDCVKLPPSFFLVVIGEVLEQSPADGTNSFWLAVDWQVGPSPLLAAPLQCAAAAKISEMRGDLLANAFTFRFCGIPRPTPTDSGWNRTTSRRSGPHQRQSLGLCEGLFGV